MNIQELASQYGRAWAEHNPDAVIALHTEDTVFHVHGEGRPPAVGAAAVREAIGAALALSPDLRFERSRVHLGQDHLVTEYVMSGTVDGKPFSCEGCDVITVRDGLVARKDTYLDWAKLAGQVDLKSILAPANR